MVRNRLSRKRDRENRSSQRTPPPTPSRGSAPAATTTIGGLPVPTGLSVIRQSTIVHSVLCSASCETLRAVRARCEYDAHFNRDGRGCGTHRCRSLAGPRAAVARAASAFQYGVARIARAYRSTRRGAAGCDRRTVRSRACARRLCLDHGVEVGFGVGGYRRYRCVSGCRTTCRADRGSCRTATSGRNRTRRTVAVVVRSSCCAGATGAGNVGHGDAAVRADRRIGATYAGRIGAGAARCAGIARCGETAAGLRAGGARPSARSGRRHPPAHDGRSRSERHSRCRTALGCLAGSCTMGAGRSNRRRVVVHRTGRRHALRG